jgi:photosystem II stability/assembly factor-like uncharacterized protein
LVTIMLKSILNTALLAGALAGGAAQAASFADPLLQAAVPSALAARAPINGLAEAGKRLVAVGQRGHILYSDDAGANWRQARVPVSVDLTAVYFADAQSGWAVGHDRVILHSGDGGASWTRQADGRGAKGIDERPLLDIRFDGPLRGMAVGAFGLAMCTADGGANWWNCEEQFDNPQGYHLNAIRSIDGVLYVAGEQGFLARRAPGEARFTPLSLPYRGSLFGVTGDAGQIIAYGLRGNAWRSTDGGKNWTQLETGVHSAIAAAVRRTGGGFILLAQSGQMLFSRDGSAFAALPQERLEPVTAALGGAVRTLLVGGVRGLRTQPVPE